MKRDFAYLLYRLYICLYNSELRVSRNLKETNIYVAFKSCCTRKIVTEANNRNLKGHLNLKYLKQYCRRKINMFINSGEKGYTILCAMQVLH
jgi:hypothetical protein